MKNYLRALILLTVCVIFLPVHAEPRHIHVNGEHLTDEEIQMIDRIWGQFLPNAYYWLNYQNGEWGYENNDQVMGVLQTVVAYHQQQRQQQQQPSSRGNTEINSSQNGSVVSGKLNGRNCTFASAGGTTFKVCD